MHLTPCNRPAGILEPAPSTSLREAAAGEQWDGFWCVADGRHYSRSTARDGSVRWFRIADDAAPRLKARRKAAQVVPFPMPECAEPRMLVGRYRGQAMLVGTRRRREPAERSR